MRQIAVGFVASILVIAGGAGVFGVDPGNDAMTARVEQLIKQLGDDSFAKREAASRELETIGEPALPALRKSADTDSDPEIRSRARRVVETLAARAGERELAKWAGFWKTADGVWLEINGQRWSSATPTWGPNGGRMWVVETGKAFVAADMLVEYGPNQGQICRAIYKLEGDRLRCCSTYNPARATEFKALGGYYLFEFNRAKK